MSSVRGGCKTGALSHDECADSSGTRTSHSRRVHVAITLPRKHNLPQNESILPSNGCTSQGQCSAVTHRPARLQHQPTSRAVTRCQHSRALPTSNTRSWFPTIDRPKKRRKSRLNPIVPAKQRRAPRGLRSTNWEIGSLPCPTQYHRNTRAVPVKQVSCSPPRPTQKVEPAAGLPDRLLLPLVAVLRYTSSATPTPRCAALYFPDCMEHESNRRILRARLGWCAVWETILAGTQQRDPA